MDNNTLIILAVIALGFYLLWRNINASDHASVVTQKKQEAESHAEAAKKAAAEGKHAEAVKHAKAASKASESAVNHAKQSVSEMESLCKNCGECLMKIAAEAESNPKAYFETGAGKSTLDCIIQANGSETKMNACKTDMINSMIASCDCPGKSKAEIKANCATL